MLYILFLPIDALTASTTANYVYAAPNGSAGTPSFRKLVAADIPNLAASKITSGTIAAARLPISTTQVNSTTKVPSSSLLYSMNTRISDIESKFQYVEMKAYASWSGSADEQTNGNVYKALPDGVSNVKKVDFYFNETPYMEYSHTGSRWDCTNVSGKETITLSPGSSVAMSNSRNTWKMGVATDGRPYMYLYNDEDLGGAYAHWNIALTFYM